MKPARSIILTAVSFFVAAIAIQLTLMARLNSSTWDEPDHTYAAYMQYKGDFGLNPEHPPLVKFLAALPLQTLSLKLPPMIDRPYRLQEVVGGHDFLFENNANQILFRARLATLVVTLLISVLVFLFAQEIFSPTAGLLALALIAFDPTLLAHSALVTTDAGQALFMLGSIYAFYRYMRSPTIARLVLVGLVVGLALATKHSAVLLFPMLVLLAATELIGDIRTCTLKRILREAAAFFVIGAISVVVLWSFYGFRFVAREGTLQLNPSMAALLRQVPSHFEASVLATFEKWHLLPQSYLYGFAHVLIQSNFFHSYLLGTTYPHSVWFYFPVAMLIKSTLTFLILLGVSIWAAASGRFHQWREARYLLIPAAVYMAFAMVGGMNIGVRHVLPVYVFLSVAIAGAVGTLVEKHRNWLYAVVALLLFQTVSVLHAFPAYVSYANEAFGGPANVHKYLADSSSDWAQQMKAVKAYVDQRGIKDCWFAYFGQGATDFPYYGIPCKPLVTSASLYFDRPRDIPPAIDGPVLMSAGVLAGFEFGPGSLNPYEEFKQRKPVYLIDYGVFVFDGHFDIPLAAELTHVQKAGLLLQAKEAATALSEAQQAETLAPESASVNEMMGHALDANDRPAEARPFYQKALTLAQTVEPNFQVGSVSALKERLKSLN